MRYVLIFLLSAAMAGCQTSQPAPIAVPTSVGLAQPKGGSPYDRWVEIANGPVPGFAGASGSFNLGPDRSIYNCMLYVMLTDTATQKAAALRYFLDPNTYQGSNPPECGHVTNIRFRQVKYGFIQLNTWYKGLTGNKPTTPTTTSAVLDPRLILSTRIDVRQNRLVFSSPDTLVLARVRKSADSLSVPADALEISGDDYMVGLAAMTQAQAKVSSEGRPMIYFEFQVDKPAAMRAGEMARIVKVQNANLGISGDAQVQFVVDTDGKPDRSTLKILYVTDDRLSSFLGQILQSIQFTPAEKGAKTVPQLVQTKFHF